MAAPGGATEKARKIAQKEELASFIRIFVTTKGAVLGEHWVPPTLLCKDSSQPNVYIDFAQGFEGQRPSFVVSRVHQGHARRHLNVLRLAHSIARSARHQAR